MEARNGEVRRGDKPALVDAIETADVALSAEAGRHRHHPAVRAAGFLSEIADQPPAFTLAIAATAAGIVLDRPRLAEGGLRCLAALTVVTAAKSAVKAWVVRTRPSKLFEDGEYETGLDGPNEGPWNSFPSGHAANAVACARAIGRVSPEAGAAAMAGALAIAAVQVPRAAHHALDVVAGAALGWGVEAALDALWPEREEA
ncbi:phosphatase PAP2 family protein [Paracoccus sp. S-4012]|uniref:phosphatase PAP2 family protein n=1 Tax=Paracoccus sp. S-4012 TaxID=2665648 RepID=UPI0012B07210|nr:phosphatase PAP2 family protein [Paracoccus sp. S-4012]MRX51583.1 phosphatase PAP2 family protein [Paracoccus sp. S-4012]